MKRYEKIDPPQNHARSGETPQTPSQETPQTAAGDRPHDGELSKYIALTNELQSRLEELSKLHVDRTGYQTAAEALKAERARLESAILDSVPDSGKELAVLVDTELVNTARLSALERRIEKVESELHTRLPLVLATFCRLRAYVVDCVLDSCRAKVRELIAPDCSVDPSAIDVVAICGADYVAASRIKLPSLSYAFTQPLEVEAPHWSSLVRPYSSQERAQIRAGIVSALVQASNELCEAARRLVAAAEPYAQGGIPPFRCEPEVEPVATVDPRFLEWQQPLHGSEREVLEQLCRESGRDPNNLSEVDARIVADFMAQRRAMPQSHGMVLGPMIGSTTQEPV